MGRIFIASLKRLSRDRFNMFWILVFPIALGTLFNIAFSNLDAADHMNAIPVAVVCETDEYGATLQEAITSLSEQEEPLLAPIYCDKDEALKLLENKEITGILYSGESLSLSISANMSTATLNQSILQAFVEEYNLRSQIITDVVANHPEKIADVTASMETAKTYNQEKELQKNPNVSTYTQYFYNQIAMACLYAAMAGILVAVENQGNISSLAARKNISATKKHLSIIAELAAAVVFEFTMNLVGFLYLCFVLKTGVGTQLPYALLALLVGVMAGVSLGFLIGSIGKKGKEEKSGIMFAVVMPLCFLSGLMAENMRIIIDATAPILNKINPAALITDSFYCLSIFEGHARYTQDIVSLLIFTLLFTGIGLNNTRRTKYASI